MYVYRAPESGVREMKKSGESYNLDKLIIEAGKHSSRLLERYYLGECSAGEREVVERHIASCERCSTFLRVRALADSKLKVDQRSRSGRAVSTEHVNWLSRLGGFFWQPSLAYATTALMLLALVLVWPDRTSQITLKDARQVALQQEGITRLARSEVNGALLISVPYKPWRAGMYKTRLIDKFGRSIVQVSALRPDFLPDKLTDEASSAGRSSDTRIEIGVPEQWLNKGSYGIEVIGPNEELVAKYELQVSD